MRNRLCVVFDPVVDCGQTKSLRMSNPPRTIVSVGANGRITPKRAQITCGCATGKISLVGCESMDFQGGNQEPFHGKCTGTHLCESVFVTVALKWAVCGTTGQSSLVAESNVQVGELPTLLEASTASRRTTVVQRETRTVIRLFHRGREEGLGGRGGRRGYSA